MKTKICIIVGLLGYLTLCVHAETRTYNNLRYTGDWMGNAIVIEDDELVYDTIYYDYANSTVPIDSFKCWSPSGDIKIIESTPSYVVISSTYAGKSRITYEYGRDPNCGNRGYFSLDIFKHFDAYEKYGIEIEGPDCVGDSETVVYSVKPLLTRHINSGVGMDMYEWSIVYPDSIPFVDTVTYVSGDSSSITFKTGQITSEARISVRVGRANQEYLIFKKLGKNAPKPIIDVDTACFMYGEDVKTFHIQNPVEGVLYQWNTQNPNWNISPVIGPEVTIKSSGDADLDIVVTAYYEGQEACSATQSTIKVKRSWGDSIVLECISDNTLPYRFGEACTFKIAGEIAGTSYDWTLPSGWDFVPRTSTNTNEVQIFPSKQDYLKLVDTLRVAATNSCAGAEIDNEKLLVYIKPAKVTSIDNPTCLTPDSTYTFHIIEWEDGPKAATYKWLVDGNEKEYYKGDSLVWTAVAGAQTISVIPRGAMYDGVNYYWGDTATFSLTFQPTPPDSIIPSDTCLFAQSDISTTLQIQTPIAGQTYHWTVPNGWDITCDVEDSSIVTYSCANALQGEYTINVSASGLGNCSLSTPKEYSIKVDTMDWDIAEQSFGFWGSAYYLQKDSTDMEEQVADWYAIGTNGSKSENNSPYIQWNPRALGTLLYVTASFTVDGCTHTIRWPHSNAEAAPTRAYNKINSSSINNLYASKLGDFFPNPANETLMVELNTHSQHTIFVLNNSGKLVKMFTMNELQNTIDVSYWPTDYYYFIISNGEVQETHKILIQH